MKASFKEIQKNEEYKKLLRAEKKIKEDFHSNRDLYNYIRGIASRVARLDSFDENNKMNITNKNKKLNTQNFAFSVESYILLK